MLKLGKDVIISQLADIKCQDLVIIGNHVSIDSFFYCSTGLQISNYVHIGPHVSIIGGKETYCRIGDFSGMAAGCRIVCASDEYQGEGIINPIIPAKYRDNVIKAPIILENFVTLATNVVVLPGVTLAEGTVVSVGSVVTKSTQPWTIYAGTPARAIKDRPSEKMIKYAEEIWMTKYGNKRNR